MTEPLSYLPDFFEPMLAEQYGDELAQRIIAGCFAHRKTTLRANTLRASHDEVATALDAAGIAWEPVSWYGDAFVIANADERNIRTLPLYDEGKVYLQSLSSMIPALVMQAQAGEDVCDLCAAPGGKTTQIAALAGNGAYITACEMHAPRAEKLEYNLNKLGTRRATVMRTDARRLDDFFSFDRVLVDAPCSGSGTIDAESPKTAKRFTEALVAKSAKAQRALLSKALHIVRPGGMVVYSTCSVLARENEEAVRWALDHAGKGRSYEMSPIETESFDGCPFLPTSIDGTLALCPTDRYEGFFVAKIMRKR